MIAWLYRCIPGRHRVIYDFTGAFANRRIDRAPIRGGAIIGIQHVLYAALTFWLLTVVLIAWGVHRLWCGMARPRVVNAVLLPGTLVAQT